MLPYLLFDKSRRTNSYVDLGYQDRRDELLLSRIALVVTTSLAVPSYSTRVGYDVEGAVRM